MIVLPPCARKVIITKSTALEKKLEKIIIIKFNNIMIMAKTFNSFNTKFLKVKSIVKFIGVKFIKKYIKNLKISMLEKPLYLLLKNHY